MSTSHLSASLSSAHCYVPRTSRHALQPVELTACTKRRRLSTGARDVSAQGLLEDFMGAIQGSKPHAPELVRIDMDSEGGLGGTSEGVFGPLAAVLIGYHPLEFETFRAFMIDMDADIVQLICCNGDSVNSSLQKVLESPTPDIQPPALGARRAVVLSGMTGAEVSEVIGAYNDSGLPETVWAAAVPMNYDRKVSDLVKDIYGDHMYLRGNPEARPQ